jgi:hypothetical protein
MNRNFWVLLVMTLGLLIGSCDTTNGGVESITITISDLPENGEAVIWLSTSNSSGSSEFSGI